MGDAQRLSLLFTKETFKLVKAWKTRKKITSVVKVVSFLLPLLFDEFITHFVHKLNATFSWLEIIIEFKLASKSAFK